MGCDITPAKLVFKNGGLLSCRFWFLARIGSLPDALGHATPSKSLPGAWWGIFNEDDNNDNDDDNDNDDGDNEVDNAAGRGGRWRSFCSAVGGRRGALMHRLALRARGGGGGDYMTNTTTHQKQWGVTNAIDGDDETAT